MVSRVGTVGQPEICYRTGPSGGRRASADLRQVGPFSTGAAVQEHVASCWAKREAKLNIPCGSHRYRELSTHGRCSTTTRCIGMVAENVPCSFGRGFTRPDPELIRVGGIAIPGLPSD